MPDAERPHEPTQSPEENGGGGPEEERPDGSSTGLTRRQVLAGAGATLLVGGGIGAGATLIATRETDAEPASGEDGDGGETALAEPDDGATPLLTFSTAEAATLGALVARLVPSDENGPGAEEARVLRYIDRALSNDLSADRRAYFAGLEALDAFAEERENDVFVNLAPDQQDRVVAALEANEGAGFTPPTAPDPESAAAGELEPDSSAFFELVRAHTLQGMFGDPYHGGNADFVGWELIGYRGILLTVPEEQQDVGDVPDVEAQSTYDFGAFGAANGEGA